jgi:excisionase family DNA binding protein
MATTIAQLKQRLAAQKENLLKPSEAAERLRISRRSLGALTASGEIPSVLFGRRIRRYSAAVIDELIEQRLAQSMANGK